jgi:hypothetical protein
MDNLTPLAPTPSGAAITPQPKPDPAAITGIQSKVLFTDENTSIKIDYAYDPFKKVYVDNGIISIETKDQSDTINITVGADNKLTAYINGMPHKLPTSADNKQMQLYISSSGGNDRINIDPLVQNIVLISGGDGDDWISAGGGYSRINGGAGNDYIEMGSGTGLAYGGDGNDVMVAGKGHAVMSGGNGDDKLFATLAADTKRQVFLNGDSGNDQLYAGAGINVLNGGLGDDTLFGHHQTTFYTGAGKDTVNSYSAQDKIYAQDTDTIHNASNAPIEHVKYVNSGKHGFKIEGKPDFISNVEDYLEQLRGSPSGQIMLQELDRLAIKNGGPVVIKESEYSVSYYRFRNSHTDKVPDGEHWKHKSQEFGYITDGQAGSVATHAEIGLDGAQFGLDINEPPLLKLYHQMVHAFNGAHGTMLPGSQPIIGADGKPVLVDGRPKTALNLEYQAFGIPTGGPLLDFDNNPLTPPTATNPPPFTVNHLRTEMGTPPLNTMAANL